MDLTAILELNIALNSTVFPRMTWETVFQIDYNMVPGL